MRYRLQRYINGEDHYTPIMNIMMNNHDKDWYVELGKYIDSTIDISKVPDLQFISRGRPKSGTIQTTIKNFFNSDKMFYFNIASFFLTSSLDDVALRLMFGEPMLHSEFGEGFGYDQTEIQESYASYFVTVGVTDFHIGYDHRGTRVEIGLADKFNYDISVDRKLAKDCFESLKGLVDLYKEKVYENRN